MEVVFWFFVYYFGLIKQRIVLYDEFLFDSFDGSLVWKYEKEYGIRKDSVYILMLIWKFSKINSVYIELLSKKMSVFIISFICSDQVLKYF